ncbi:MAG: hypothetical protein R6X27_19955 [Candidatus Desulfacyla sp.]
MNKLAKSAQVYRFTIYIATVDIQIACLLRMEGENQTVKDA